MGIYKGKSFNREMGEFTEKSKIDIENVFGYRKGYKDGIKNESSVTILPRDCIGGYEQYYLIGKQDGATDRADYENLINQQTKKMKK